MLRLPRKLRQRSPTCCACHDNCNSSCENDAKVLRLPRKTTFDTLSNRLECHKVPRLPRKTTLQLLETFEKDMFRSFPHRHGEATGKRETRDKTRGSIKTSIRQFSSHLTKCHTCHGICTLSPLDTALTQKYCACHTKRRSTPYEIPLNVTKCHACHAKRSNQKFETSKNDSLCRTYHRHGQPALTRPVANGCARLHTVGPRPANTPSTPRPPE